MDQEIVIDSRDRSRGAVPLVACAAGLVAAGAHAAVVREHLGHWWGYGAFFAVVAVVQAIAAVSLNRRPSRRLMLAVVIGNLGLILLYALSRALGTSFVGPHAGHAESIGLLDLAAKAGEGVQVAAVLAMLRLSEQVAPRPDRSRRLALVALLAVAAVAVAVPGAPAHEKSPANAIKILAADQIPDLPEPHDVVHTEEPQLAPVADEPSMDEPPAPCKPHAAPGDPEKLGSGAVVYSYDGDLWIVAQPAEEARRLTTDGFDCLENAPTFRDRDTITFAGDGAIYDLDLTSGQVHRVVEVPGGASAIAWSPDGSELAYLSWGTVDGPPAVRVFSPSTGKVRVVRAFDGGGGRCGSMDDETSIAWSPDGSSLLIVATVLDFTGDTMFVLNLDGKDLVAPRLATHARWTHDSNTVLYRGFSDPRRWYSLDLESARNTFVPMHAGTHHAAVSPDGRYIAYSDESERPTTYIFDLERGLESALVRGYAAPLWLSSTEIALTKTMACGENCMGHGMWMEAGETAGFDLSGDRSRSLSMKSTLYATVLLAPESAPAPAPTSPAPSTPSPSPSPSPSETANPIPLPTDPPTTSPEPSPSPTASA